MQLVRQPEVTEFEELEHGSIFVTVLTCTPESGPGRLRGFGAF
jgi:hypothetical protein